MGAILSLPDLARGHPEPDVFGCAALVFPELVRRARAIAPDLPLIGLFDQLVHAGQGHPLDAVSYLEQIVVKVLPIGHRLLVLTVHRDHLGASVTAAPARLPRLLVDTTRGVALLHPGSDRLGPRAIAHTDALHLVPAQHAVNDLA